MAAMDPKAANYVWAGAGTEDTIDANVEAFRRRRIVPRMLRDVSARDLSTTVLGTAMPAPLLLAPIGVQAVVHPDGELATARAAAAVGAPMIVQHRLPLQPRGDRRGRRRGAALVPALLAQRSRAGPQLRRARRAGRLRRDRPHRRHLHPRLEAARPAAGLAALPQRHGRRPTTSRTRSSARRWRSRRRRTVGAATGHFLGVQANPALSWDDLAQLRAMTSLPIVVKGIQHVDDAREAVRPRRRRDRRLQPRRPPGRRRDRLARRAAGDRRGGRRRPRDPLRQRRPRRRRRAEGARPRRRRRLPRPPLRLGPGARRPGRGRSGAEDGPRRARPDDGALRPDPARARSAAPGPLLAENRCAFCPP